MYRTSSKRINSSGLENPTVATQDNFAYVEPTSSSTVLEAGSTTTGFFNEVVDFRVGDVVLIAKEDNSISPSSFTDHSIRAEVISSPVSNPNVLYSGNEGTPFELRILSISSSVAATAIKWYFKLEDRRPLFENRFPRFSYR